jgi:hypothetical protein
MSEEKVNLLNTMLRQSLFQQAGTVLQLINQLHLTVDFVTTAQAGVQAGKQKLSAPLPGS